MYLRVSLMYVQYIYVYSMGTQVWEGSSFEGEGPEQWLHIVACGPIIVLELRPGPHLGADSLPTAGLQCIGAVRVKHVELTLEGNWASTRRWPRRDSGRVGDQWPGWGDCGGLGLSKAALLVGQAAAAPAGSCSGARVAGH